MKGLHPRSRGDEGNRGWGENARGDEGGNRGPSLRRAAQGGSRSVLIKHWEGKCIGSRLKSGREGTLV